MSLISQLIIYKLSEKMYLTLPKNEKAVPSLSVSVVCRLQNICTKCLTLSRIGSLGSLQWFTDYVQLGIYFFLQSDIGTSAVNRNVKFHINVVLNISDFLLKHKNGTCTLLKPRERTLIYCFSGSARYIFCDSL